MQRMIYMILIIGMIRPVGLQADPQVTISVDPTCTRQIAGISELKREKYFGLSDGGTDFDQRCQSPEMYKYLVQDLGIRFGRQLGPIKALKWKKNAVIEDATRPGHVDLAQLQRKLTEKIYEPSETFRQDIGDNLNVAAHGSHNAFPDFMGKFQTAQSGDECLPENIDAAAELSAATFEFNYSNFNRPAFYEPVNEPHWSFYSTEHLALWHLATQEKMNVQVPSVQVGGPCSSVAYFYRDGYRSFNGFRNFIDQTDCDLDFYSFHCYDYLAWDGNDITGRVTSGLPLEAVIDLVQNYTHNTYGKEVPLVVSEHGGYINDNKIAGYHGASVADEIAQRYFPGTGFAHAMKKRSIVDHVMVSSVIANTLTFMDHPHVVQKAVPFILLNAFGWDPQYYAVLYVPEDYSNKALWVPTQMANFYQLFRDLRGRRVLAQCNDPDIQTRAFVDANQLTVVLNNLSDQPHDLTLNVPEVDTWSLRRLKRHEDFTPSLIDQTHPASETLTLEGREAIVLKAHFAEPIAAEQIVNETIYYGDQVTQATAPAATFTIKVPVFNDIAYATLRIGLQRTTGSDPNVEVQFNGHPLDVPLEDCAQRLDDGKRDYATIKLIDVDPSWLAGGRAGYNQVTVSFPDGGAGAIGSVVLRVAIYQQP